MLESGRYIVIKSDHYELQDFKDEVVYYIHSDYNLADLQALYDMGFVQVREATMREKELCFLSMEYTNERFGVYVKDLDKIEKFFKNNTA